MVAAALAGGQTEAVRRIGVPLPRPAQEDHGGQILLPLGRGGGDPMTPDGARDTAIQKGRRHLDGVTRHDTAVEDIEPARRRVEPRAVLDHHVVVDAVALRFAESRIGDLVHADRAGRRLVHLERIPRQTPAPVRPRHGVARPFDLGERGQEGRRDDGCRVLVEERPVAPPGLDRALVERTAHRKEQLGRLADRLVRPIGHSPGRQEDDQPHDDPDQRRRGPQRHDGAPHRPGQAPARARQATDGRSPDPGRVPPSPPAPWRAPRCVGHHEAIMPQRVPTVKTRPAPGRSGRRFSSPLSSAFSRG